MPTYAPEQRMRSKGEDYTVKREQIIRRWNALRDERSSWFPHWQEISDFLLPRSGRYFTEDRNKGSRRHNHILNNTATQALQTLGAGLHAHATNPVVPWARVVTGDPAVDKNHDAKLWLDYVTKKILRVFSASNTYPTLHQMYEELGAFGTACSLVVDDYQNVIHHHPVTVGEFAIAQDYQGNVCTLYREFDKTVGEIVKEFGKENCSQHICDLFDRGQLDEWITLLHAIEPRSDRDSTKRDSKNMAWRSCYVELKGNTEKILREGGFESFPALVPRWTVTGGDIYGQSPGMVALGDIKGLQHAEKRLGEVIDYRTNPPKVFPTSLKNRDINTQPGGRTFADTTNKQVIQAAHMVDLDPQSLEKLIERHERRIERTFSKDLFLMLATQPVTSRMTAAEVTVRDTEKMLMLGPVIGGLEREVQIPLIERVFYRLLKTNSLPPPPPALYGRDLKIEFISILAQAQRSVRMADTDRFVGNLGAIAQMKPDVLDKFDSDAWVDMAADALGVDPTLVVASENVVMIRKARNDAMAAKEQTEMIAAHAKSARDLAGSPTDTQNALTALSRTA